MTLIIEPTPKEWYERTIKVLTLLTVTPSDWNQDGLTVDRSEVFPVGTFYPRYVPLVPVHGPHTDEWWAPDVDLVNEDDDDPRQGYRLAEALTIIAGNIVALSMIADRRGDPQWWQWLGGTAPRPEEHR